MPENETHEGRVSRLTAVLSHRKSRIRTYLGLYALRNHVLIRNGCLEGNCPTISWYLQQLSMAGVSRNYWNVRRHLKEMASRGILVEKKSTRPVENNLATAKRLTLLEVCEFHLEEALFPAMHEALKRIFGTDSLASLYLAK